MTWHDLAEVAKARVEFGPIPTQDALPDARSLKRLDRLERLIERTHARNLRIRVDLIHYYTRILQRAHQRAMFARWFTQKIWPWIWIPPLILISVLLFAGFIWTWLGQPTSAAQLGSNILIIIWQLWLWFSSLFVIYWICNKCQGDRATTVLGIVTALTVLFFVLPGFFEPRGKGYYEGGPGDSVHWVAED
jgi:hypothetical protein